MPAPSKQFNISVIMESQPSKSPWLDVSWRAVGIANVDTAEHSKVEDIIKHGDIEQHVFHNMTLKFFQDECESYYHNLMSPHPGCYIVARENDNGKPIPFLISLSFDEAHAYQEGDDLVYSVEIPAELYHHAEAYIIENYLPIKRKKRKRKDWKKTS